MIPQDAVAAALLAVQAAATYRQDMDAQAARLQRSASSAAHTTPVASPTVSSTRSTVPRTRLNMSSPSLVVNALGGTSTSVVVWIYYSK